MRQPDRPWLMRTYSGHSSPAATNTLYRENLARGQTGLSVAFDLPTQTGYDADHPLARGEVGKVGVPVSNIEDMTALFEGIPLGQMNTSMTCRTHGGRTSLAGRHYAKRRHQRISVARHAHLCTRTFNSAHPRRDYIHHR
jgi:methylmalonyl-CoA mutase N-terminal domain/subunit